MIRIFVLAIVAALAPSASLAQPTESAAVSGEADMLDAVMAAIRADDAAALARLLDADPSLAGERDASGMSPLSLAVYMQRPPLAELIRARRGTPDVFEAVMIGDAETVRAALAAGQDVDAFAPDGFTLLGLAVFFGQPELAVELLEAGADPSLRANNAQRVGPIHASVARGDIATLERLLVAGGDPNLPQQQGFTPLHGAAAEGSYATAGLLLLFGADPSAKSEAGKTPAELAGESGHDAFAERLERR